ncbi:MAG TPA: glucoamylase family protein, partial [Flavisolibacter sp.]|nr:glucoamylase family protein [Flavisolibacter sp.]
FLCIILVTLSFCCNKKGETTTTPPNSTKFAINTISVNGIGSSTNTFVNLTGQPEIQVGFNEPLDRLSLTGRLLFTDETGTAVNYITSFTSDDSSLVIKPSAPLQSFTNYSITVSSGIQSKSSKKLETSVNLSLKSALNNTDKFPRISDNELLDLVQRQTFKYFWEFGHPVSGMARERNTSGDLVTSGGTGFGIMAIVTAISRNFISRMEGLARLQKIVTFLKTKVQTYHGAFPHWLNGATGETRPFSDKDNGADLVETSYLMQGLLTARQYFNGADALETNLRNDINSLWNAVDWDWFRKNNGNVLYWHWSENFKWEINQPISGWNEALITYVLAASSPVHRIPKVVYDQGWARNGAMRNGNSYYGFQLPLGPPNGGPLFFAHYSFLGINPSNLVDAYANYWTQNRAHTFINYNYCKTNPKGWVGYSDSCWGLTASDNHIGYVAHEPNNDLGVITPTAALSSFPYTPNESMKALHFFYYKLGDKIWGEYGFKDAFNLSIPWFANSYLAIDQGPIIVMIENYRTGLLWNLFMSCPEVKTGMRNLGFTSPYL